MKNLLLFTFYLVSLLLFHVGIALKCRAGNQQTEDQFQKILQVCQRRYLGQNMDSTDFNSDDDSSENSSNSEDDLFDQKFYIRNNNRYSTTWSPRDRNNMYNRNDRNTRNGHTQFYVYNDTNNNSRDMRRYGQANNNKNSMNSNQRNTKRNGMDTNDSSNDYEREQACVIQCFFNELNVVDYRGFPEKSSVIRLMTENIRDPELQDFVENSIIECFHYLNSDMRKEKCTFSRNLLSCLAGKGKERCEDWDM